MEFLYSITMYKCGVYNIPEKLHMITTFFTYYGTNLVFPVHIYVTFLTTKYPQYNRFIFLFNSWNMWPEMTILFIFKVM